MAKRKTAASKKQNQSRSQTLAVGAEPEPQQTRTWQGQPLPDDVVLVDIKIPVFIGAISKPVTQLNITLMTEEHKTGLDALFNAIIRVPTQDTTLAPNQTGTIPPYLRTRTECARFLFSLITEAMQQNAAPESNGTPK